jgi:uncharacterized repeat protein (TIGR01451 family)
VGTGIAPIYNRATASGLDPSRGTVTVYSTQTVHYILRDILPLDVIKSANPPSGTTVAAGSEITYTVTVTNTGSVAIDNVTVTDQVPSGTTFLSADPQVTSSTGGLLTWLVASIPAGGSWHTDIRVRVNENSGLTIIYNRASIAWSGGSKDSNIVEHPVGDWLGLQKTANPPSGSVIPGGSSITYTLALTNYTNSPISNVTVTDTLPTGATFVSATPTVSSSANGVLTWTGVSLTAGETKTFYITVQTDSGTYALYNRASASSGGRTIDSNQTVHFRTPPQPPIYDVSKSANPVSGTQVSPGGQIVYFVTVTNRGTQPLTNVVITDSIPARTTYVAGSADPATTLNSGLLRWTIASIPASGSRTVSFAVQVDSDVPWGTIVRNSATIISEGDTVPKVTNIVEHTVGNGPTAHVKVTKAANPPSGTAVAPGQTIEYTLTVQNDSGAAANNVTVTDQVPAGTTFQSANPTPASNVSGLLTWSLGTLSPGETKTIRFTVAVNANLTAGTGIYNKASVTWTGGGEDSNTVYHPVDPSHAYITVVKSANPPAGTPVMPNDLVTYYLQVVNNSAIPAYNVRVQDTIPTGAAYVNLSVTGGGSYSSTTNMVTWTIATLSPGLPVTLSFQVRINPNNTTGVRNMAYYSSTGGGGTPDTPTNEVVHPGDPMGANLGVYKVSDPPPGSQVGAGAIIRYTITVTNYNNVPVYNVPVRDPLPPGMSFVPGYGGELVDGEVRFVIPVIAAHASASVSFQAQIIPTSGASVYTVYSNTAYAYDIPSPPVVLYPEGPGGITSYKSASPAHGTYVTPGQEITYSITVHNNGTAAVSNLPVYDTIPAGTTYVTNSASNGGTVSGGQVRWTLNLAAGATATLTFKVTVNPLPTGTVSQTIRNAAVVNNTPTNEVENPVTPASVDIYKSTDIPAGHRVVPGDIVTFYLDVTNRSGVTANNVVVRDPIPAGTTYQQGSANPTATLSGNALTWTIAQMTPYQTLRLTFKVVVASGTGSIVNTATVNDQPSNTVVVERPGNGNCNCGCGSGGSCNCGGNGTCGGSGNCNNNGGGGNGDININIDIDNNNNNPNNNHNTNNNRSTNNNNHSNVNNNTPGGGSSGGAVPRTGEAPVDWVIILFLLAGALFLAALAPSAIRRLKRQ